MENKEEKDNKNNKELLNKINNKIELEKKKIKNIEYLHNEVVLLNRNVDGCIEILSKAMIGPTTSYVFEDMHNRNKTFFVKTTNDLDEQKSFSQKTINKLSEQKEELSKETKN